MERNNKSGIFRKRKVYFTQVSNVAIRDKNLSFKAKGLYALIQSFITIEDFVLYKSTLRKYSSEGDTAFENVWKELKTAGYLIQYKLKNNNGHYFYEYELLDEPDTELAKKIHTANNAKKEAENNHPPKTRGVEKNTEKSEKNQTPENGGVVKYDGGEVGGYNNTDSINTYLNNINTSTSTEISIEDLEEARQFFEDNICKLKKTTLPKFINIINKKGLAFTAMLIRFCTNHGTTSFNGFQFFNQQYTNIDQLEGSPFNYKKNKDISKKPRLFREKNYDYDALERELLGWDD